MLTLSQKPKAKVSWAPFYYIMSIVLGSARLNYFSDTFNDTLWKKVGMFAILIFQVLISVTCLTGMLLSNNYDREDSFSCLIILLTEASIVLKVLILIYHSATLKVINDAILTETNRNNMKAWQLVLAQKYYKFSKWICIKIIMLYLLTMVSFIGLPMLSDKDYMMPILMEFPGTNRSGHPGYEINYFIGAYGVFYGTTIEMGFDIPAFLQACFISYQLDRCVHYCDMIGDFDSAYNTQKKQSKLLKKCIKLHASIFDIIKKVATVNTSVVAITVVTTVPLLTVLLYSVLLGTLSASPCMMIACAYHLFMYCFLGEIVSIKCREASNAVYTSSWYRIETFDDRRTFLFFLTVSQYDLRFSAGGLYKLSLETYTELMKRVYGACAFLNEVL